MRRLIHLGAAVLAVAVVVAGGMIIPARAATAGVAVRDVEFDPSYVRIEPGDTVRWTWEDGGHTVTSKTGAFEGSGTRTAGSTFEVTFADTGTFEYKCEIHSAMEGTVQVGPPPEPPPPIEATKIYVPDDVATIAEAVQRAQPGTEILVDPRIPVALGEPVTIETAELTVKAGIKPAEDTTTSTTSTTSPSDRAPDRGRRTGPTTTTSSTTSTTVPPPPPSTVSVTAAAGKWLSHAFEIEADGVVLESLSISDFTAAGVIIRDAGNVVIAKSDFAGNRDYGIQALGSNVAVTDVTATGSRRAGVSLQHCDDCGTVTRLEASGNFVGFEALDATSVVLRWSTIHDNANGVIVQTRPPTMGSASAAAGADILGNVVRDNDRTRLDAPTIFETESVQPAAGVGIWLAGASDSQVRENEVHGHRWGIVASVLGDAATDDRITTNVVGRSVQADLAWDGIGTGTCFAGNSSESEAGEVEALRRVLLIETLYACDGTAPTVGIPDPTVTGDIALAAMTTYYCRQLEVVQELERTLDRELNAC